MTLESLILSQDTELVSVIRPTLEELSIDVEICQEARKGADLLVSDKFDAVIVDCDDLTGGLAILQGIRNTPSNKNSVAFAVLNGKRTTTQEAFGMGANFVLQKPITTVNAARCFHAALNFMLKERRRYFRQPVNMPVEVTVDSKTMHATSTNISEGGMALALREALPKGATPSLKFCLPLTDTPIEVEAEVAWADLKGIAGLRFHQVSKDIQQLLERWLDARIEEDSPGTMDRISAVKVQGLDRRGFQPPPDREN
ncbi:MAG TPA: PilZ domain-containing protein [Candidatus Sulfotelmatobacter sp.]|nr:PilZ domain-containing protein [Candidatus Sulfotelmatobacter sp.]